MTKKERDIIVEAIIPLCADIAVWDLINELGREIPSLKAPFDTAIQKYNDEVDLEEKIEKLAIEKFVALGHPSIHWQCNRSVQDICSKCIKEALCEAVGGAE